MQTVNFIDLPFPHDSVFPDANLKELHSIFGIRYSAKGRSKISQAIPIDVKESRRKHILYAKCPVI